MMSFETPGGKDARRVIVSLLALVLVVGVGACGGETAESRTSFDLEIVAKTLPSGGLKSDDGYTVTLREAKIVLGPLRFYSGEPLFSRRGSSMTSRILLASSLAGILWDVPEAQAHPGHYQEGDTLAEWLEMRRVDLLAITPTRLGQARGVTGSYRSMMLALVGPPPAAIGGKTLTLAGVAKKGTRVVRFSTAFDLGRDVIGIPVDSTIATSTGGKARVEVDLRIFISRVGFDALPVSASTQEVTTLDMSSQAYNAIYRGFVSTDAYGARWVL